MIITCRKCQQQTEKCSQKGNICRPCYNAHTANWKSANKQKLAQQRKRLRELKRKDPDWVAENKRKSREARHLLVRRKGVITCRICKQQNEVASQSGNICRSCYKAYLVNWRVANKEQVADKRAKRYRSVYREDPNWVEWNRQRSRDAHRRNRHEAIMAYGGYICACCGETEPRFMTLDHIANNGAAHRRTMGNQNSPRAPIWRWLKENKYPEGFQVLCMNCNAGREWNGGICPHKTAQETPREFRETPVWAILSEAS